MKEDPLCVENTLWANTVLASGTATCVVIYTGRETRSSMNTSSPRSKVCTLITHYSALYTVHVLYIHIHVYSVYRLD